jgi:hypothetical protein
MSEKSILQERDILVTTARLVVNGSTYAMRNIDSVRVVVTGSDRESINAISKSQSLLKSTYIKLMGTIFLPLAGIALGVLGGGWNWLWLPVCLVAALLLRTVAPALNSLAEHRLLNPYVCVIRTSGRELEAFRSDDGAFLRRVADAIGNAIAQSPD